MPIKQIPDLNVNYYLINYDADGNERAGDDGKKLSQIVLDELKNGGYTDVILMSHGWMGDIPAAVAQYDKWIRNLFTCTDDIEAMKAKRPGFKPLFIGLHWPSQPWGDEDNGGSFGFDPNSEAGKIIQAAIDDYAARLGDTPQIRQHLQTILTAAIDEHDTLPDDVRAAYEALGAQLGFGQNGEAVQDLDTDSFEPEQMYQEALDQENEDLANGGGASFGKFSFFGALLSPLRTFSFWKMKNRARNFGETGANALLRAMQKEVADAGSDVGFHLMGHSFGCAVVTAMAAGKPGDNTPQPPVNSITLVQGAFSIWSYCPDIPSKPGTAGYFNPLIKRGGVKGPIVTTQSEHDRAVGLFYKLGAGIAGQVSFGTKFPDVGGLGAFGIQGLDQITEGLEMKKVSEPYNFKPGRIYNLESSDIIKVGGGAVGAHSDIAHPEVAHALWQAALAS